MFSTSVQQLPCDVLYARLSPNRSRQLVGYGGRDAVVYVYPFSDFTAVGRLEGLAGPVTAMAFDPDQRNLAAGSDTGALRLWEINTEKPIRTFGKGHTSTITDMDFHKSGLFVATASTDTNLRIWDTRKSSGLQSYKNATDPLCAVQFSPNGKWVATGCARGVVRLYNLVTAKPECSLELHTGAITSLHFHPERYYLAVGSVDGTISVWNLETFEPEFRSAPLNTPVDSVQFCGARLLAAADHKLHVYHMTHLADRTATVLSAPWTMISDLTYASFGDEAWFVEANGSTAMTGRIPLGVTPPATTAGKEETTKRAPLRQPLIPESLAPGDGPSAFVPSSIAPPRRAGRAAQRENYVVEKPRAARNEDPFTLSARSDIFSGPAPTTPAVPVADGPEPESEAEALQQMVLTSSSVKSTLSRRLTNIRIIRSLWSSDPRAALQHLRRICADGTEGGAVFDFLTAMQQQRMKEKLPMNSLCDFLDVIQYALRGLDELLLLAALRALRSANTKFRARVEEGHRRTRASHSNGYNDPLGMNTWKASMEKLGDCALQVMALSDRGNAVGDEARLLIVELPPPRKN